MHRNTQCRKKKTPILTLDLILWQVHWCTIRQDIRDGANSPVHQSGGHCMHRHVCVVGSTLAHRSSYMT